MVVAAASDWIPPAGGESTRDIEAAEVNPAGRWKLEAGRRRRGGMGMTTEKDDETAHVERRD